ncbi:MAG: hypothetical protein ABL994_09125 [Verrucomicrobiales bacterium]
MEVPESITCVDCGQTAHRLSYPPEEGWEVGDYVAYRCSGCNDRWDLVVAGDEPDSTFVSYASEFRAILERNAEKLKE